MSAIKDALRKQIQGGRRSWSVPERTPEACDLFEVEVVLPLRELKDEGRIETLETEASVPSGVPLVSSLTKVKHVETLEIQAPVPGRPRVVEVTIRRVLES